MTIPIGTMMELPRACQTADVIAKTDGVNFMSFGTNVSAHRGRGRGGGDTHYFAEEMCLTCWLWWE